MNDEKKKETGAEQYALPPAENRAIEKKSFSDKLAGLLRSDDYKMIFSTIYKNVIDPSVRRILVEAGNALIRGLVYRNTDQMGVGFDDHTNYGSFFGGGTSKGSESKPSQNFEDIPFRSEEQANEVLNRMRAKLNRDRIVLVADYYRLAGRTPKYTQYSRWGWLNLNSAYVFPYTDRNGRVWVIHLPEPVYVETVQ